MPTIGFNLKISEDNPDLKTMPIDSWDSLSKYSDTTPTLFNSIVATNKMILQETITKSAFDNIVNGTKLSNKNFPIEELDIFISHSHSDINLAKQIAAWIKKELKLSCFIDSISWNYATDLLKNIDDKYCKIPDNSHLYSYKQRNLSTSHVYMMLATALCKVMENSKYILFLNTDNSCVKNDFNEAMTFSPWLYYELKIAEIMLSKQSKQIIKKEHDETQVALAEALQIRYSQNTDFLITIESLNELKENIENRLEPFTKDCPEKLTLL